MPRDKNDKTATTPLTPVSYIDAHLHLADPGYEGKVEEIVQDADRHNVSKMLTNATDYQSSLQTINQARTFPERVLAAVGVHPSTVLRSENLHLEAFERMIEENSGWITAIGEIGLDGKYTADERIRTRQTEVFRFFLNLAEKKNLPVVVHSRQAVTETLNSLARYQLPRVLMHWYDGPPESLALLKERGYMISIGPALLYSRKITEIGRSIDEELILTETDGPVSYRGIFGDELTKPWFVGEVVKKLAEVRGTDSEAVQSTVFSNFKMFVNG